MLDGVGPPSPPFQSAGGTERIFNRREGWSGVLRGEEGGQFDDKPPPPRASPIGSATRSTRFTGHDILIYFFPLAYKWLPVE